MDVSIALGGLLVGFVVGLTGMGGGALMTPLLVLGFGVPPLAAVSSDLVASVVMKPIGGSVHLRRGTVHKGLVAWLMLGSVPSAFLGVLLLRHVAHGPHIQDVVRGALGIALLIASAAIVGKEAWLSRVASEHSGVSLPPSQVKPLATVLIGVIGGLVVGMTSVGSGSLMMVMLVLLYPRLRLRELVGTDLVQAIPLVLSAAIAHLLFGQFELGLTLSVVLGAVPGVYFGARLSASARDGWIRPLLVVVLVASGLKLIGVSSSIGVVISLVVGAVTTGLLRPDAGISKLPVAVDPAE